MSNLEIDIVSEYKGRQAFNSARGDMLNLGNAADKLTKKIAGAFAVYKIVNFAKQSVAAYTAEEKALSALTTQLNNVGLGMAGALAPDFLQKIQDQTGVLKDETIPAYAQLARVTGSVSETQRLLSLAMDVSAGTGNNLQTVTDALSKAYIGNTKSLINLNLGITKADVATMNFKQITDKITNTFAGSASRAADTYAGKIARLSGAFDEFKQSVGGGILTGLGNAFGAGGSIDEAVYKIKSFGLEAQAVLEGIGNRISELTQIPGLAGLATFIHNGILLLTTGKANATDVQIEQIRKYQREQQANFEKQMALMDEQEKLRKANAAAEAKAIAEANKKAKEALAIEKARLYIKQASRVFDQQAAQIAAALKYSKLTEDEKTRLELMQAQQQLQDAIDNKQYDLFAGLEQQITDLKNKLIDLKTVNPFETMDAYAASLVKNMNAALDTATKLSQLKVDTAFANYQNVVSNPNSTPSDIALAQSQSVLADSAAALDANVAALDKIVNDPYYNQALGSAEQSSNDVAAALENLNKTLAGLNLSINIDGATIANAVAGQSAAGVSPTYQKNAFQGNLYW